MTNAAPASSTTWENWSARDTLTRALANVTHRGQPRADHQALAETPAASALDALRDSAELVELLAGWQWQAMYAARREGRAGTGSGPPSTSAGDRARAGPGRYPSPRPPGACPGLATSARYRGVR